MGDLPNYDNWLQDPYWEQLSVDDCPPYMRYLEEWYEEHKPDYEDYCEDAVADGETPMSYEAYLKDCGLEPQPLGEFIDELNQAMYEEELRLRGYDF